MRSPASPSVRAKTTQCVAVCMPVVHIFSPSMRQPATPSRVSRTARVSMWVASDPCIGLRQTERQPDLEVERATNELFLLLGRAEVAQHDDDREIADDRVLVLQVVVQPEPLGRQMLADHGHPEVRTTLAAELDRQAKSAGGRLRRQRAWLRRAVPPIRPGGGRPDRNPCAPTPGGDRRNARCRPSPGEDGSSRR